MKNILPLIICLTTVIQTFAQDNYPVSCKITNQINTSPGAAFTLESVFKVDEPWYIYAPTGNNAAQGMVETTVIFNAPKGITRKGKPAQPKTLFKGGYEVLSGTAVKFSQTFEVDQHIAPGEYIIKAKISYQACNEKICLPPKTDELEITVSVANALATTNVQSEITAQAKNTRPGKSVQAAKIVQSASFQRESFQDIFQNRQPHSFASHIFLDRSGRIWHRCELENIECNQNVW